jgi:hypothetical protein
MVISDLGYIGREAENPTSLLYGMHDIHVTFINRDRHHAYNGLDCLRHNTAVFYPDLDSRTLPLETVFRSILVQFCLEFA